MAEFEWNAPAPKGSEAQIDLCAVFTDGEKEWTVKGFYAGNDTYKVRFLPEKPGRYSFTATGSVLDGPISGIFTIEPAAEGKHGPVRADGIHLRHADGTWFYSFGTTVYALAHQSEALMAETFDTLSHSPFNKVRLCVFPKHYNYNHNNPKYYAFKRSKAGEGLTFEVEEGSQVAPMSEVTDASVNNWDVHHPCYEFWDAFENKLKKLAALGIEADLILFHPYDRWGFATMPQQDNLVYLDYLLRRLSAFPNVWWSLANEYDLCRAKSLEDWNEIEEFVAANDPFHHLLSNHNCLKPWDWSRPNVTHVSWQSKQMYRVGELQQKYKKPVLFDECRYEGTLPESWGNLSGRQMTQHFWQVTTCGGYCTHGETFFPGTKEAELNTATGESEVVWWACGGRLHGESPARIAFLRSVIENLPGPLEAAPAGLGAMAGKSDDEIRAFLAGVPDGYRTFFQGLIDMGPAERDKYLSVEFEFAGKTADDSAFLFYKDSQCCSAANIMLPQDGTYRIELLDTWEMTRETVMSGVSGMTRVMMPGKPYMAILAIRE